MEEYKKANRTHTELLHLGAVRAAANEMSYLFLTSSSLLHYEQV